MSEFRELFRLSATHEYYDGICRDLEFVIPQDTVRLLARGKMRAKEIDNTMYVVYETNGTTTAMVDIVGFKLRFGLRVANPYFENFTTVGTDYHTKMANYEVDNFGVLAFQGLNPLVENQFRHVISTATRPVTVTATDPLGAVVHTETVTAANAKTEIVVDARAAMSGLYTVTEVFVGGPASADYYVDSELLHAGAVCVAEVEIVDTYYDDPAAFEFDMPARQETLRYYIVADGYSNADMTALDVDDTGFSGDGRPEVTFTRVESGAFTADELPASLVATASQKLVMFKSSVAVPRRGAGRTGIQLLKGVDVVVANLPQPGPEKADAHMIVHIAK